MILRTERVLWSAAFSCLLAAIVAGQAASPEPVPDRSDARALRAGIGEPTDSLGARVLRVVSNDPFRLTRTPSAIPFGGPEPGAAAPVAAANVPPLQLRGVLGPPWRAVLEGVPGSELSQLVGVGDSIAGARVIAVRPDAVTLRTTDTTWTLSMRRP